MYARAPTSVKTRRRGRREVLTSRVSPRRALVQRRSRRGPYHAGHDDGGRSGRDSSPPLAGPRRRDDLRAPRSSSIERYSAHNYHPLPVVVAEAEGAWVTDVEGKRYLDMLAAYSALNFGHRHPDLIAAAREQLDHVTLTSRAFHNDQLGPFCKELAELCGMEMVLPMNTGAEAVETALKTARRWGYDVKGVPEDRAKIVTCSGNFHGRTITIVSFSTDPDARGGFGPFTPGFETVPYGDADALEAALADPDVVGFLVEPIQGEAGRHRAARGLPAARP